MLSGSLAGADTPAGGTGAVATRGGVVAADRQPTLQTSRRSAKSLDDIVSLDGMSLQVGSGKRTDHDKAKPIAAR